MFYTILILRFLLSIFQKIISVLRLTIPFIYMVVVLAAFPDWYNENMALGDGIGIALLVGVAISWIVTFVRKIREKMRVERADQVNREALKYYRLQNQKLSKELNQISESYRE